MRTKIENNPQGQPYLVLEMTERRDRHILEQLRHLYDEKDLSYGSTLFNKRLVILSIPILTTPKDSFTHTDGQLTSVVPRLVAPKKTRWVVSLQNPSLLGDHWYINGTGALILKQAEARRFTSRSAAEKYAKKYTLHFSWEWAVSPTFE